MVLMVARHMGDFHKLLNMGKIDMLRITFILIYFLIVATYKEQDSRLKLVISKAARKYIKIFLLQFKNKCAAYCFFPYNK